MNIQKGFNKKNPQAFLDHFAYYDINNLVIIPAMKYVYVN